MNVDTKGSADLKDIMNSTMNSSFMGSDKPLAFSSQLYSTNLASKLSSNKVSGRETYDILESKLQG